MEEKQAEPNIPCFDNLDAHIREADATERDLKIIMSALSTLHYDIRKNTLMMYAVFLKKDAEDALAQFHTQDFDWCLSVLNLLSLNPFPEVGRDKEKLRVYENRYRIHIGRFYTAIYKIDKEKKCVCISYFGKIISAQKERIVIPVADLD